MMQCRKIYCNLLMLSVMLFMLGVSGRPRPVEFANSGCSWGNPDRQVEFKWNSCSGAVVYRGQQLTASPGSELDFIVPVQENGLIVPGKPVSGSGFILLEAAVDRCFKHISRAPPAV